MIPFWTTSQLKKPIAPQKLLGVREGTHQKRQLHWKHRQTHRTATGSRTILPHQKNVLSISREEKARRYLIPWKWKYPKIAPPLLGNSGGLPVLQKDVYLLRDRSATVPTLRMLVVHLGSALRIFLMTTSSTRRGPCKSARIWFSVRQLDVVLSQGFSKLGARVLSLSPRDLPTFMVEERLIYNIGNQVCSWPAVLSI